MKIIARNLHVPLPWDAPTYVGLYRGLLEENSPSSDTRSNCKVEAHKNLIKAPNG